MLTFEIKFKISYAEYLAELLLVFENEWYWPIWMMYPFHDKVKQF